MLSNKKSLFCYSECLSQQQSDVVSVGGGGPAHDETIAELDGLARVCLVEERGFFGHYWLDEWTVVGRKEG